MHIPLRTLCVLLLFAASSLAGCVADDEGNGTQDPTDSDPATPAKGRIAGTVVDERGAAMGGIQVDLSRLFISTETASDGAYAFPEVPAGTYRLTFTTEHYRRLSEQVTLDPGEEVTLPIEMEPIMIAPGVPSAHGKHVPYVAALDTLLLGASLPGVTRAAVTNETKENTFPGFWEIEPEDGYLIARLSVTIFWVEGEVPQGLGLHYFRGEGPLENELVEGPSAAYHEPEPSLEGPTFAVYTIENEDWLTWGDRTWQIGVFAVDPEETSPAGAAILHNIIVQGVLIETDYAASA